MALAEGSSLDYSTDDDYHFFVKILTTQGDSVGMIDKWWSDKGTTCTIWMGRVTGKITTPTSLEELDKLIITFYDKHKAEEKWRESLPERPPSGGIGYRDSWDNWPYND